MATTTNYGWTTPDDTALVKDGAAAIRTLGSSVDTTTKNLNPETTLGDIAYRSSTANVNTRLGLGTALQVLRVNSGATAPEWATPVSGGMTLLSTTTLSGASTTISSINQTYNNLYILISGIDNASNSINKLKPNSSSITDTIFGEIIHLVSAAIDGTLNDAFPISARQTNLAGNTNNVFACEIFNYASTTNYKVSNFCAGLVRATSSANTQVFGTGLIKTNSAITDIEITSGTGNFSGGTVLVYGVK
jgi:hypothetical protein